MKNASLLKLLSDFADLGNSLGATSAAQSLKDLRKLFLGREELTVAKYVGDLTKRRPSGDKVESETIRDLRSLLSSLSKILISAECKSAASDIDLLLKLLKGCDHSDFAQFVADANSWGTKSRGRVNIGNADLRTDIVAAYVDKLRSSERQNDLFDQVMQSLRADKRTRLPEVRAIASAYLGLEIAKKKTKADTLKAIGDHQAFNARQMVRGSNQT